MNLLRTWYFISFLRCEQGREAIDDVLVAVNDARFYFLFRALDRVQIRVMEVFDFLEGFLPAMLSQIYYVHLQAAKDYI